MIPEKNPEIEAARELLFGNATDREAGISLDEATAHFIALTPDWRAMPDDQAPRLAASFVEAAVTLRETCPALDQRAELWPGDSTWAIHYEPGHQRGQMSHYPATGRGAVEMGGDSAWGDFANGILTCDDGTRYDSEGVEVCDVEAVRCDCGQATGERCEWTGPACELVTVEFMPAWLRASHEAAGNRGVYPANRAIRFLASRDCAASLVDADPEWTAIIGVTP